MFISNIKIKYSLIGLIVVPIFGRLALSGTGHEGDLYRYLIPALVGCVAGFLIGREHKRFIVKQKELFESQEYFRTIADNTQLLICRFKPGYLITYANESYCKYFGKTHEELIGTSFLLLIPEPDRETVMANISTMTVNSPDQSHEHNVFKLNGVSRWTRWTNRAQFDDQGQVENYQSIGEDITERKEAEKALKINDERLKLALEGADLGLWDWDLQTNEIYFNPRYLSMLGYGPTELPHNLATWENLLHPNDKELAKQNIQNSIEKGSGKWGNEFRLRHKDGQYQWISGRGKVVEFSQDGLPLRAAGTHLDITARKVAEEKLKGREERFREIFNNMSSGVAIYEVVEAGNDFVFKDINRVGLLSSKLETHEVVGKKVTEFFPGLKETGLIDAFQRVYETGIPEHFPNLFYQDDKQALWVENYVCRIPSGEIISIYDDITDRKKSEEELSRANEEWEKTFDAIPDIVTIQDKNMQIVRANKAAADFFAMEYGELIGQKCYGVFSGTDDPCPGCPGIIALEDVNNHIEIIEHQRLKKIFQVSSSPLFDANGEVQYLIHMARDITEQKKMEEELLKGRKLEAVGVLAGGIAHDFNNILAAILGNISLALTTTDPKDETYELLVESEKASLRAKDLTRQLLTFSKGGEPVKKIAAIDEIVRDSANFVLRGSKVRCDCLFSKDLSAVEIDSGQISQVIQNIVLNASQAMPTGGIIEIDCINYKCGASDMIPVKPGNYIKTTIKDNGVGIPKDLLDNIFDPYFTTKQKGSGLGLAITHSIISKHGGSITVDSEPGRGTTFSIYLPASQGRPEPEQKDAIVPSETAHGRIMIMDDEEMIRNLVHKMLSRRGYEVVSAEDGERATQLYQEAVANGRPIDLIIMDLTIPGGMGGKEAIKEIHKIDPEAKVIVSSGYSNDPVMADFGEYGFCGAMVKPFQMRELMNVVGKALSS